MSLSTHLCFAAGCKANVNAKYLMCRKHWFMVPRHIQTVIWATVGIPEEQERYVEAVCDAAIAVAEKEGLSKEEAFKTVYDRFAEFKDRAQESLFK